MALGRKTGGRDFPKGNPGRPVGARDRAPRTFRALAQQFVDTHEADIEASLERGVRDRRQSHKYLAILAGLEKQQVELGGAGGGPVEIRFRLVDA